MQTHESNEPGWACNVLLRLYLKSVSRDVCSLTRLQLLGSLWGRCLSCTSEPMASQVVPALCLAGFLPMLRLAYLPKSPFLHSPFERRNKAELAEANPSKERGGIRVWYFAKTGAAQNARQHACHIAACGAASRPLPGLKAMSEIHMKPCTHGQVRRPMGQKPHSMAIHMWKAM